MLAIFGRTLKVSKLQAPGWFPEQPAHGFRTGQNMGAKTILMAFAGSRCANKYIINLT